MSDRCYLATRKGLFTVDRRVSKWSVSRATFVGDNVTLVMHDPRNGNLFAALNHGHFGIKVHRSTNGGETWDEITAPQYPPMPEGYVPKPLPFFNKPLDWALKLIWGLAPGGADQPGLIWCGSMPAEYYPAEQQGDPNVQDVHCLVQCAANPEVFWVQHHNGIFRSSDGARSWTEIKDVKPSVFGFPVAVHPHDPNSAWFLPSTKD